MMFRFAVAAACGVLGILAGAAAAQAHPHVWVTVRGEVVYGPSGAPTALRFAWTFDEAFSIFSAQGLDTNNDGKLSREELAPLAEVNVSSLKEFDYFTFGKSGEVKIEFSEPVDYWLAIDEQ